MSQQDNAPEQLTLAIGRRFFSAPATDPGPGALLFHGLPDCLCTPHAQPLVVNNRTTSWLDAR